MSVNERFFKIGDQWNVVHLPQQPNGFGILIVGDVNHYVNENSSSWLQHPDRQMLIKQLTDKGYTVFSSHLFGNHWGSDQACHLAIQLYHMVMKQEILNKKIHIIGEGMGALAVLKLMKLMEANIRSVALINPCLHLYRYFKKERKNKLFYKRLLYELAEAYGVDKKEVEDKVLKPNHLWNVGDTIPIKIFHDTRERVYSFEEHSRRFERYRKQLGYPIEMSLFLPGKSFTYFTNRLNNHFKKYEKKL
ncbi:alpha/beta hydrolase family protein [Bacillus alkalicellulosilyticus]|uniref:alpha/beta hydrolase family protein n=1 Tax=Alkalihalobacterium alkalicellulosilyticum TaxID=1912214 RepID=UPI000997FEEE|nr:alpha/beta hydrolase [Bacillus alkalicellulosilyticus]